MADEWCVLFSNSNSVGVDGYEGLDGSRRLNLAVFSSHQEAKDHRDTRAAANPGTNFQVVKLEH